MTYVAPTWRGLGELTYPVTWRWILNTPNGFSSVCFSADLPLPLEAGHLARPIGEAYFKHAIAPAISEEVTCPLLELTRWKVSDLGDLGPTDDLRGIGKARALPLELSPCIALHTAFPGSWGTRRMHLGGARADLAADRQLTRDGAGLLLTIIRGLAAATVLGPPGNRARAIVVHPGEVSGDEGAPSFPTWRDVVAFTVCTHLEKAPSWP